MAEMGPICILKLTFILLSEHIFHFVVHKHITEGHLAFSDNFHNQNLIMIHVNIAYCNYNPFVERFTSRSTHDEILDMECLVRITVS